MPSTVAQAETSKTNIVASGPCCVIAIRPPASLVSACLRCLIPPSIVWVLAHSGTRARPQLAVCSSASNQRKQVSSRSDKMGKVWHAYIKPALTENVFLGMLLVGIANYLQTQHAVNIWIQLNTSFTPMELATGVTFVLTTAFYWTYALMYFPVDLYHLMDGYKLQPKKHVDWNMHIQCMKGVVLNQVVVGIPQGFMFAWLWNRVESWSGSSILTSAYSLPTPSTLAFHFLVFAIVEEVGFYYSHRLAHHPAIYKAIHKQHHIFTSPIAAAAIYAHPIEHCFSNLAPVLAGPLTVALLHHAYPAFPTIHLAVVWSWMIVAQFTTITTHSGYKLWGMPDSRKHDFHHEKFNVNYGVLGILDYIHGTDKFWLEKMCTKAE